MSGEIIAALISAFIVLCGGLATLIWQASSLNSKVDQLVSGHAAHVKDDDQKHNEMFHRLNEAEGNIKVLNARHCAK